jgi:imidazolonepropionase-like amidohydrolase
LVLLAAPLGAIPGAPAQEGAVLIRAEKAYVSPSDVRTGVSILVQDGRITAIGPDLAAPEGAQEIAGTVVCAAFCDPWSAFGLEPEAIEDQRTAADTLTTDALDPYLDERLRRELLGAGVGLLRLQAGATSRMSGVGAFVRNDSSDDATLLNDCCVAATIGITRGGRGSDPFDRLTEVDRLVDQVADGEKYAQDQLEYEDKLKEWEAAIAKKEKELEEGFKKAKKDREKEQQEAKDKDKEFKEKAYKEDKRPTPPRYDPEKEVLARVAKGELPLVVEVHRAAELRALLDGTERFATLRLIIAGGSEALSVAQDLAQRQIPVMVRPVPLGEPAAPEYRSHDLGLAGRLAEAGVQVLLGSGGRNARASRELPLYAAIAIGHGLERERALEALTIGAARALDVGERVGTLELGKEADLLVLDGEPLETATRVRYALSAGKVVLTPEGR